jgi:hypothetical protein
MTAIHDDESDQPRTHALVIGVGYYAHLPGGEETTTVSTLGLGQLASPPISAVRLSSWLLEEFNNAQTPLGSVELLLSTAPVSPPPPWPAERATLANIRAAYKCWLARCDRNPGNLALFYYCGHGVEGPDRLAVLCEDFGADPDLVFGHAIDFVRAQSGMGSCKAGTRLFIADACREVRKEALAQLDFAPVALKDTRIADLARHEEPRLYATGRDRRAFGRPGEPSLFLEALLSALNGGAAERDPGGQWTVTISRLISQTALALERLTSKPGVPTQTSTGDGSYAGNTVLHVLPAAPPVRIRVTCDPETANAAAQFALHAGRATPFTRAPMPGEWAIEVPPRVYDVEATFAAGPYATGHDELWAFPPGGDVSARVKVTG